MSSTAQTKAGNLIIEGVLRLGQFTTANAPSGTEGALYFDTTESTTKVYSNSAWEDLGGSSFNPSSSIIAITPGTTGTYALNWNTIQVCQFGTCCPPWKDCDGDTNTYQAGTDCDEGCSTCFVGSTTYTLSPDGKDQDCDGVVDDTNGYCTSCTVDLGSFVLFGYNSSCNWAQGGSYNKTASGAPPAATAWCSCDGESCTYGGWGGCSGTSFGVGNCNVGGNKVCASALWYEACTAGSYTRHYYNCKNAIGCTVTSFDTYYH